MADRGSAMDHEPLTLCHQPSAMSHDGAFLPTSRPRRIRATAPSGRTTILLFVFFHALYALTSSGNAFRIPDEFEVYFQTEHLVDAGDLSIPQTLAIRQPKIVGGAVAGSEPIFYGKFGVDGRPY